MEDENQTFFQLPFANIVSLWQSNSALNWTNLNESLTKDIHNTNPLANQDEHRRLRTAQFLR